MDEDDVERDEVNEVLLGAAGRARLYKARAAAIEAQLANTDLPRLREKLVTAAARFRELAVSEDLLVERKNRQRGHDVAGDADLGSGALTLARVG